MDDLAKRVAQDLNQNTHVVTLPDSSHHPYKAWLDMNLFIICAYNNGPTITHQRSLTGFHSGRKN